MHVEGAKDAAVKDASDAAAAAAEEQYAFHPAGLFPSLLRYGSHHSRTAHARSAHAHPSIIEWMDSLTMICSPNAPEERKAEVEKLFKFVGRFVGKAILDGWQLDFPLSDSLFKVLYFVVCVVCAVCVVCVVGKLRGGLIASTAGNDERQAELGGPPVALPRVREVSPPSAAAEPREAPNPTRQPPRTPALP
jgi:hypothetical protein